MVFAGYTEGDCGATNAGGKDFAAAAAFASFSGTPEIASPTATDEESETSTRTDIVIPVLITLSVFAFFGGLAYRMMKGSSGRCAENVGSGGSVCRQEADVARQVGVVPYAHAVAVPATGDADGSGRAWTVVTAEVVE